MSGLNACDCCAKMPELDATDNRPGLPAIQYRIGVYGSFLQRLLDQIHSVQVPSGPNAGSPPLAALTTRAPDDPAISLLDAWAVIADVLTFYQERIANEGYLRTATERLSILQLAREIGYELAPGVASGVLLQFTADNIVAVPPPGSPAPSSPQVNAGTVTIPAGTQVQSIPAAGQQPQTFETSADFVAYVDRNALQPRLERPPELALYNGKIYLLGTGTGFKKGKYVELPASQIYLLNPATTVDSSLTKVPAVEMNQLYVEGVSTNLKQGDRVLLVGFHGSATKTDRFIVHDVETDSSLGTTIVNFSGSPLATPTFEPAPLPTALPGSSHLSFSEASMASKILDSHITETALEALVANNSWDVAQVVAQANSHPVPPASDFGAFAMRSSCGLFGNNATQWKSLPVQTAQRDDAYPKDWDSPNGGKGRLIWTDSQGNNFSGADVFLERTFPQVLADSWAVFESAEAGVGTYQVSNVVERAIADYGITGRATGLKLEISVQTRGTTMGSPAIVQASSDQVDVFAIGEDGHLYRRWRDASNKWQGAENLGGTELGGSPSAVSWGKDRIDVFAIASNGHLYHWYTDGNNKWNGPENLGGGKLAGSPSAVSRQDKSLDIVSIGSDGNLYHVHFDNDAWAGPDNWGPGNLRNNPSAVSLGPGGIAVFALGKDGDLYQTIWLPPGFRVGPVPLLLGLDAGLLVDSPSAVLFPLDNSLYVAMRSSTGQMVLYSDDTLFGFGGLWMPVLFIDGNFIGSPSTVTDGLTIQVFATGADGDLYQAPWAFNPFLFQVTSAKSLGGDGNLMGSPAALSQGLTSLEVAAVGASGHWFYTQWGGSTWDALKDLGNGHLVPFLVRTTTAYVQSDQLQLAGIPVIDDIPKGSNSLMLNSMVIGLEVGQPVSLTGNRTDATSVAATEMLTIQKVDHTGGYTTLTFKEKLQYGYQRTTVSISANVAAATNGGTVQEVLGSGDASQPAQSFTLKKSPLTFVAATTATSVASTLQVSVNNVQWSEVPSFYGLNPSDRDYTVRLDDTGTATIAFGDPAARLKTGQQNVTAKYRTGSGLAGNVAANSITTLMSRPPGLRAVTNPRPASGGSDPQPLADARTSAPLTVLTLERVVSLADYENFARAFVGVGKAQAIAVWSGETRMVYLTVAAADGSSIQKGSQLYNTLLGAINGLKDPVQIFQVGGYQSLAFNLSAALLIDKVNFDKAAVYAAVTSALIAAFSFDNRAFGQAVTAAEIVTLIQKVPGVLACDLSQLYLSGDPAGPGQTEPPAFLASSPARWENGAVQLAQLLLLNAAGVTLKEMAP
jgi:hypothetical protein